MAKGKKTSTEDYGEMLKERHENWRELLVSGGRDPFYADGVNMNLVRNHILYYRKQVEELSAPEDYPEAYHLPVPDEVDSGYIARKEEILANAKRSLAAYEADESYQYLIAHKGGFSEKTLDKVSVNSVIGYVSGLKLAIEEGDYVYMRRHEDAGRYIDSFVSAAEKMKGLPVEEVQLSLFSESGGLSDDGSQDGYGGEDVDEDEGVSMSM